MDTEDYVSYPLALALKKAGFDYPCYFYYTRMDAPDDHVWSTTSEEAPIDYNRGVYAGGSMPTLAQAQKWLREKCGIAINVDAHDGDFYTWEAVFLSNASQDVVVEASLSAKFLEKFGSYEAALSAGIASALELIEKKGE